MPCILQSSVGQAVLDNWNVQVGGPGGCIEVPRSTDQIHDRPGALCGGGWQALRHSVVDWGLVQGLCPGLTSRDICLKVVRAAIHARLCLGSQAVAHGSLQASARGLGQGPSILAQRHVPASRRYTDEHYRRLHPGAIFGACGKHEEPNQLQLGESPFGFGAVIL